MDVLSEANDDGWRTEPVGELSGTASQVEWAERIKRQVNAEFSRVAAAFKSVAGLLGDDKRADTEAILAILEDKRAEVMSRKAAGYFIHDWQEISDQVRLMIFHDARYQAIKAKKAALLVTLRRSQSDSAGRLMDFNSCRG